MKTRDYISLITALFAVSHGALADNGNDIFCYGGATTDTDWSSGGWTHYTYDAENVKYNNLGTSTGPNSSKAEIYFYHSQTGINVDGNYTVGSIFSHASMKTEFFVNMKDSIPPNSEGNTSDGILNLVGDNYTGHSGSNFNYVPNASLSADKYYNAIFINTQIYADRSIIWNGGTVNVSDSQNRIAAFSYANKVDSIKNLTMTFTNGNTLNVANDLLLYGGRLESNYAGYTTKYNFYNNTNLGTYNTDTKTWNYDKKLYIGDNSEYTSNNKLGLAVQANIGYDPSEAVTKSNANFNADTVYIRRSCELNVKDGGNLNVTNGIYVFYAENGGIWAPTGKFSHLNIEKGASVTSKFITGYYGANISIDGKLETSQSNFGGGITCFYGHLKYGENADVTHTTNAVVSGGLLTVNAGTGKIKVGGQQIRLYGSNGINGYDNTRVILNTENAFKVTSAENANIYFQTWTSENTYDIEINANQSIDSFRFSKITDGKNCINMTYNLIFDDSVANFNLNSFTNKTWVNEIEVSEDNGAITYTKAYYNRITISGFNFKNGVFHIENWFDEDLTTDDEGNLLFSLDDANYTDLRVVSDGNGGAYLTATYIPEPSTYGFFAGILALGVVFYRRKR